MLRIHFLNVGHGDCTLIEFPSGRIGIVDINNSKAIDDDTKRELHQQAKMDNFQLYEYFRRNFLLDETDLFNRTIKNFAEPIDPVDYIKEKLEGRSVFRFILTHPDMDHMSGLYRLYQEGIGFTAFWDTANTKNVDKEDMSDQYDYRDWEIYQSHRQSEEDPKAIRILKGQTGDYWTEDGITILSPTQEIVNRANEQERWNLLSYVLLIQYKGHKIVLGGDADAEVWDSLAESDSELLSDVSILKAPHHGRRSGYSQKAVKLMNPLWTVCSVGKKPSQDAHNLYNQYTRKKVLSTRFRGTIVAEIGYYGDLYIRCEKNPEPDCGLLPLE